MITLGTGIITLGSVVIGDSMILVGATESKQVVHQQKRTIEGYSSTSVYPIHGGRSLTLGSDLNETTMGIWCFSTITEVKELELLQTTQQLNYKGDIYTVLIVDTSDFKPLFKTEQESDTKKYTGTIKLIEA
jgi:hypothetical protein